MDKPGAGIDNGLVAMNHVHSIAAKLWTEKIPLTSTQQMQTQRPKSRSGGRQDHQNQRRITPVQLPPWHDGQNNVKSEFYYGRGQPRNTPFSPLMVNSNRTSNVSQVQSTFDSVSSKKRAQIKSLPRKPPDIQNFDLFPPIRSSNDTPQRTTASPTPRGRNKGTQNNPFAATLEESSFDPKFERNKIYAGVQKVQTQITGSSEIASSKPEARYSAPRILHRPTSSSSNLQSVVNEKGRSAELFAQLTPDQIQELTRLSTSYSESLNSNLCRSILAEFTFLCQLLVANNDEALTSSLNSGQANILASLPPRVWFVTKVFEHQLPLISNISEDIIQMLIDFYPHRIPKHLRKIFDNIIQKKTQEETQIRLQFSNNFSTCVTFQTETDGRNNFPHHKDCQDFGKQRDLFYAVREIWTSRQRQTLSPNIGQTQSQPQGFDPAFLKVKQLFQMNSSPTNLSRLASLFLSQSLLDLNASNMNHTYDPGSIENIQRIFQSNPSKYEKLRRRLHLSNCVFDENQPIPDSMSFLKYFVSSSSSSEFRQHLIDHAIHELQKLEAEFNNSPSEAIRQMRKTHLLAQMLGFLYFLPYRDDEYKKPIGPINVEIYLQSQITLRLLQSFPMDLLSLLKRSYTQQKLIFTLPWVIEFLSRADQVTFHLPAYKPVLTLIASIYREILSTHSESPPQNGTTVSRQVLFSQENKTLLRFMCGKLFGLTGFPDSYLFGGDVKNLNELIPELTSLLVTVKLEDENILLDLESSIGETFLPTWFQSEMKQIITILSSNATVRGSIPLQTPGIVKHIPAIPEKNYGNPMHGLEIQFKNQMGDLQADLEIQFFQIHPSSTKKTVDFISERVASNFLKKLRNKILTDIKTELIDQRIFGHAGMIKCNEEIWKILDKFSTERCKDAVSLLLGDVVSNAVLIMCQKICIKNANERVLDWVNHHVTKELFPEIPPFLTVIPQSPKCTSTVDETMQVCPTSKSTGLLFLVLRALHNSIQLLHLGKPIDDLFIDRILEDDRLTKEKPWVTHRTIDLAMALITFSPLTLTPERQIKFITFWKKIWIEGSNSFLRPRNFILLSMSSMHKVTFQKLSSLIQNLLQEKLVTSAEILDSCMNLLRQDWPETTKVLISEFLKELLPVLESTEEKEVIDWIAWFCSGQGDEDF